MSSKVEKSGLVPRLRFPEFRGAKEWAESSFGGAATFLNGRAYKQEELLEKGKYRVLRVGNFFSNNQWYYSDLELDDDKYCNKGDLLYAWSASFGPRIWYHEKAIYHYHIWKVLEKEGVDKNFLFIVLDYETERMKSQSSNGLGLLHITKGAIESWKCLLPGIEEQQKIADCLTSLDELITLEAQQLDKLKAHKKGLMQQLFPAEGETLPRLRFPEFLDVEGWEAKLLGAVCEMQAGKFVAASEISERKAQGLYPCFGGNGLRGYTKTFNQSGRSSLIGRQGALCGNVNLAEGNFYATEHAVVTTPKPGYTTDWLFYNLCNLNLNRFATGQAQPGLSIDVLEKVSCAAPKDQKEQQKIADCLSSLDDLIITQTQKFDALKTHKKGLMQQLFPTLKEVAA